MTTALTIPDSGNIPAYIRNPEMVKQANDDAACGISTGVPPRVKVSGKQFRLVDGNGEEKAYPPAQMVAGSDGNTYMPVIVLRAKRELRKTWYASKYTPGDEPTKPDCFSDDAVKPHSSISNPQSDHCETCPLNAYGSGTDQQGNATAGKACSDAKILAVYVPNHGIHMLKIPPSSLKNWGLFVKQLTSTNIPVSFIRTFVGFDLNVDFAKLEFRFGGFLEEKFIPRIKELQDSSEVNEIIQGIASASVAPAPINKDAEEAAKKKAAEEAAKKKAAAEEAAKKKAAAEEAAKKKAAAEEAAKKKAAEEAAATAPGDDFGLGLDLGLGGDSGEMDFGMSESQSSGDDGPSDDELKAELGL